MNVDQQVISFEIAKKLLTLGIKQNSLFWYEAFNDESYTIKHISQLICDEGILTHYSAFLASEIVEILPKYIEFKGIIYFYTQIPTRDMHWFIEYRNSFNDLKINSHDRHEANARAKILINLIVNGLLII